MPAVAVRHPELEEPIVADSLVEESVSNLSSPPLEEAPSAHRQTADNMRWHDVAPYADHFAGARQNEERLRRGRLLRHRNFVLSVPFFASVVVFCEVLALLWVWSLDLKVTRRADALDKQIALVQLEISRADSKLAASVSEPKLQQWAGQFGYRKIGLTDMDDVTSNIPPTAAQQDSNR